MFERVNFGVYRGEIAVLRGFILLAEIAPEALEKMKM